jgi:alpha-beta hydrolase superfamily lysophospholipase
MISISDPNPVQANLIGRSSRYIVSGMDVGDLAVIIPQVHSWEDWRVKVCDYAQERLRLAEESRQAGHLRSAGEYYVAAAIYFHFAQLGYFEDDEKKYATAAQAHASHKKAFDLVDPPVRQLRISFRGAELIANVRIPASKDPVASVILLPGADSTKEEMITFESVLHARGMATVAFEGPGQGEVVQSLPLIEDYETAVTALMDALGTISSLDPDRIGLYGRSLGGFLAPRVAALEPRIAAVVSAGGFYAFKWDDYSEQLKRFFCYCWGYRDLDEGAKRARRSTLSGLIQKISCPFLVVHSGKDPFFSEAEAVRMVSEAACDAMLKIYPEGTHVCDNIPYKYRPFVADWFADKLRVNAT